MKQISARSRRCLAPSLVGGFITEREETASESRWTAFGRPNQPLSFSWKRKVDDRRAQQPLRVRARVTQVVGLGEDPCQVSAAVRVEVLQGLACEVTIALAPGLVVNEVNGATVADWDATGGALRVRLIEPVATEIAFVVQGESRAAREGTFVVPLLRVPSAERETGGVAADVVGAGEITERQVRGLDPADPSELGDLVAGRESRSMIAFRLRPLAGSQIPPWSAFVTSGGSTITSYGVAPAMSRVQFRATTCSSRR